MFEPARCAGPVAPLVEGDQADYAACVLGLRDYVRKNGFPGVLLGVSGGIDSALCAAIAVDALGAERVRGVMLPFRFTAQVSLDDAAKLAAALDTASGETNTNDIARLLGPRGMSAAPPQPIELIRIVWRRCPPVVGFSYLPVGNVVLSFGLHEWCWSDSELAAGSPEQRDPRRRGTVSSAGPAKPS